MEESGQDSFKIRDKRRFTAEGEIKPQPDEEPRDKVVKEKSQPKPEAKEKSKAEETSRSEKEPPRPLDFSGFILSLANTALFQLGLLRMPDAEPKKDLPSARQTIDLIALLEEKTRGNLTEQEQKIITETLFQLRMAFVEAAK